MPYRFSVLGLAPAFSSRSISMLSSLRTAQCSGVVPSGSGTLTSTFFCSSASAVVALPALIASTRRVSFGAGAVVCAASAGPLMNVASARMPSSFTCVLTNVDLRGSTPRERTLRWAARCFVRAEPPLQAFQQARAVSQRLLLHSRFVHDGPQQVGHRRVIRIPQMPSTLDAPVRRAHHEVREREVIVRVAVAHVAAVQDHRVVEQRAVAVGRVLQPIEEMLEEPDVVGLDLHVLFHLLGAVLMVRDRVV